MAATAVDRPFGGGGMRERAIWASGGADVEAQPQQPARQVEAIVAGRDGEQQKQQ